MLTKKIAILCCLFLIPVTATASLLDTFGTLLTTLDERRALEKRPDAVPEETESKSVDAILPVVNTTAAPQIMLHGFVLRKNLDGTVWYNDTSVMLDAVSADGMSVAPAMCGTACIRIQAADGRVHMLRAGESTVSPHESYHE